MIQDFFNQICTRKRVIQTLGQYNRPQTAYDIKEYPCRVVRKTTAVYIPGNPEYAVKASTRLYADVSADIKLGDLIISGDYTYHVTFVYKPNNHHLEADLEIDNKEL